MKTCENCGNEYDKIFQVVVDGRSHNFDSFECAINVLAPRCAHCDTRIIGHGVESDEQYFCCAHCADAAGVYGLKDRVREAVMVAPEEFKGIIDMTKREF